jgi:hypothetical protein
MVVIMVVIMVVVVVMIMVMHMIRGRQTDLLLLLFELLNNDVTTASINCE